MEFKSDFKNTVCLLTQLKSIIWIERPELLLPDCSGLNLACPDFCHIQQTTALYFVCFTSAYNKRAAISQKSVSKKPLFINASAPSFTVTALRYIRAGYSKFCRDLSLCQRPVVHQSISQDDNHAFPRIFQFADIPPQLFAFKLDI